MKYILFLLTMLSTQILYSADYTIVKSSDGVKIENIKKNDSNTWIPIDTNNRHYVDYLKWVNDGGTPDVELKPAPDYTQLRSIEYPKVGDQLDLIMKTIKYLKDNGIDVGTDGEKLINDCEAVKAKYPKP